MVRRARLARCVAAVAALSWSLASCGATPAAAPVTGSVRWAACDGTGGPKGAQCATVAVPIDPSAPAGPTVGVALDRLPATGRRLGAVVVNPGGPGVSAVDALTGIAGLLGAGVRSSYDIVGYDPPGVGHSAAVRCLDPQALRAYVGADPEPPGASGFASLVAGQRAFAAACASSASGSLLGHVATVDAARDLDAVRAALGDDRISYVGFSYGTLLGATYAAAHPDRVRAMVLDGALDPTMPPLDVLSAQGAAVDAQFAAFTADCRRRAGCRWRPSGDAEAALGALVTAARSGRLGAATAATVLYGTAAGLYSTSRWPQLATALVAATRGDGAPLGQLFAGYVGTDPAGGPSTEIESEAAVNCTDATAPTLDAVQQALAAAEAAGALFAALDVGSEATCSVWPVQVDRQPHPLVATTAAPVLVVGSTGDPVTPYAWAQHLAAELGSGVLLTRVGDGHTALPASACVRTAVAAYLLHLTVPAAGTRCPSG